jgi:hypothetical protein
VPRKAATVALSVPDARPMPRSRGLGQRFQGAELLGVGQGRVVRQHHTARAESNPARVRGEAAQDHRGRGGGHGLHGAMFGHPVAGDPRFSASRTNSTAVHSAPAAAHPVATVVKTSTDRGSGVAPSARPPIPSDYGCPAERVEVPWRACRTGSGWWVEAGCVLREAGSPRCSTSGPSGPTRPTEAPPAVRVRVTVPGNCAAPATRLPPERPSHRHKKNRATLTPWRVKLR